MATRPLSDTEKDFAEALAGLLQSFGSIHEKAQAVKAAGGDCQEAFLSVIPDDAKDDARMQWPYVSLMLGV